MNILVVNESISLCVLVSIETLVQINHFKSMRTEEQKVLSRKTLPISVEETYKLCDVPPSLDQFTPYRDDLKKGLTFYTDPDYFYRLWVEDQEHQLEKKKKKVSDELMIDKLIEYSGTPLRWAL